MRSYARVLCQCLFSTLALLAFSSKIQAQSQQAPWVVDRLHFKIHVEANGTATIDRKEESTVFSNNAVDSLSQQRQPYSSSREQLELIQAWTQRADGQRVDVAPDAVRDVDEYGGDLGIYSDQKVKVVIFPNVGPGSQLHSHTKRHVLKPLYPGHFMLTEAFHPNTIYRDVLVELTHANELTLYVDARGMTDESERTKDGKILTHRYRFQQNETKGYESDSVDWADLVPYFHASTFDSVQTLAQQYANTASEPERVTPEIKRLADSIVEGLTDPLEQAKAIYEWVTREVRYVGIYLGDSHVVPNRADDVLHHRYGDCKDHNTLLVSLLTAKGIEAQGALVNLGRSYALPKLGVLASLNHVVTYLPQWNLFLDSTDAFTPFGVLSFDVMDKPAVLTRDARIVRTPRSSPENNWIHSDITLKIQPDGVIQGWSDTQLSGSYSLGARSYLANYDDDTREEMVRQQLENYMHTGQGEFEFNGVWERHDPMQFRMRFALDPITNFPGQGAFSLPGGLAPGSLAGVAAKATKADRQLPFPCTAIKVQESYRVELPTTTRLSKVPHDVQYVDEGLKYNARYRREGDVLLASRQLSLEFPTNVCFTAESNRINRLAQVLRRDMRSQVFYQ